jgi:hypothetical protein
MGKFLFQLIGTLITLSVIGFIGYCLFTRLFQSFEDKEQQEFAVVSDKKAKEKEHNSDKVSATIKNINVEHNVERDGAKGMQISVEFDSKNLKGETLYCMVRFYNDDGSPLVQTSNNEKYRSINGNVIVGDYTSPPYDDCETRTPLFIPYSELPTKSNRRTDLILDATILHYQTKTEYDVLDRSKTYSFYLTND